MEIKPIEGPKQYFKRDGKYYKIVEALRLYDNKNDEYTYFYIKLQLCKLEHDKDMMIPVSDYLKELKKVSFYDLIPTGRSKKVKYLIYHSQLIDNFIVKDV